MPPQVPGYAVGASALERPTLPGARLPFRQSSVRAVFAVLPLVAAACVTGAGTAGQPTALERQLLGAYEELDEQLASASSVRAGGNPNEVSFAKLEALALEARATQRFNEDDIGELKTAGCLAETLAAQVARRECTLESQDAAVARRLARIVDEENRARRNILTWAGYELARREGKPGPSKKEMADLTAAYQRLLYESAEKGHVVEREGGEFFPVE